MVNFVRLLTEASLCSARDVEDAVPYKKSIGTTQAGRRGRRPLHQDNSRDVGDAVPYGGEIRDVSTSFLGVLRKDAIRNDIEEIGCSLALRLPVYN